MVLVACHCLNVKVHVQGESLRSYPSAPGLNAADTFFDAVDLCELGLRGITTEQPRLIKVRTVASLKIVSCLNCKSDVYARECDAGGVESSRAYVRLDALVGLDEIAKAKNSERFSPIYNIVLEYGANEPAEADVDVAGSGADMTKTAAELQEHVMGQLAKYKGAMDQRIRAFVNREQEAYDQLQRRAHRDKDVFFRTIARLHREAFLADITDALSDALGDNNSDKNSDGPAVGGAVHCLPSLPPPHPSSRTQSAAVESHIPSSLGRPDFGSETANVIIAPNSPVTKTRAESDPTPALSRIRRESTSSMDASAPSSTPRTATAAVAVPSQSMQTQSLLTNPILSRLTPRETSRLSLGIDAGATALEGEGTQQTAMFDIEGFAEAPVEGPVLHDEPDDQDSTDVLSSSPWAAALTTPQSQSMRPRSGLAAAMAASSVVLSSSMPVGIPAPRSGEWRPTAFEDVDDKSDSDEDDGAMPASIPRTLPRHEQLAASMRELSLKSYRQDSTFAFGDLPSRKPSVII
eukprot:Opistho-2@27911